MSLAGPQASHQLNPALVRRNDRHYVTT